MVDVEELRARIVTHLPLRVRWHVHETPWDFDFARARCPLKALEPSDFQPDFCEEWRDLIIFGEEDYAEGGGARPFLTIHRETGEILGFDIDRHTKPAALLTMHERIHVPIYTLNSSIEGFIRSFAILDEALRLGSRALEGLADALRLADPSVFDSSEWKDVAAWVEEWRTKAS